MLTKHRSTWPFLTVGQLLSRHEGQKECSHYHWEMDCLHCDRNRSWLLLEVDQAWLFYNECQGWKPHENSWFDRLLHTDPLFYFSLKDLQFSSDRLWRSDHNLDGLQRAYLFSIELAEHDQKRRRPPHHFPKHYSEARELTRMFDKLRIPVHRQLKSFDALQSARRASNVWPSSEYGTEASNRMWSNKIGISSMTKSFLDIGSLDNTS